MDFFMGRPARRQKSVSERPKMVQQSPSLTPHLVTLKASLLTWEKTVLGHSSTTMQTFMQFGVTVAEISRAILTRGQSNLTKSASRGTIPRLGVTLGGRNLYH